MPGSAGTPGTVEVKGELAGADDERALRSLDNADDLTTQRGKGKAAHFRPAVAPELKPALIDVFTEESGRQAPTPKARDLT